MSVTGALARAATLALWVTCAQAQSGASGTASSSTFCDRTQAHSAAQQDALLRFAGVVREELNLADGETALVSRSGLDLSRFQIRYSHAALAWRDSAGIWTTRQLYYACDERRPRIFDQGIAGFAMDIDNPSLGYVSIVVLPPVQASTLRLALLDKPRALRLLAAQYSANAYPFSLSYQNCNQWVMELLATAWGDLADGADLRARAQVWLRDAQYAPEPVAIPSRWLILAAAFTPFLHLDDHPAADRSALSLQVSLPASVESFVRQHAAGSRRVELCYNARQVVVHHGWTPIAAGCKPAQGDRVVALVDAAIAPSPAGVQAAGYRSRKALLITETELRLIANAAINGDSSHPVREYSTPAATGMPSAL